MSRSAAVSPHSPAPTTTTSRTGGGYPSGWDPSKWAGRFYAAYFGVLGVILPFLGPYLRWRGFTAAAIGAVTAALSLAKLGYAPWIAGRADRGRWRRGTLAVHLAGAAAVAGLLPALDGPWRVALAVLLVGAGYGAVLPVVEAVILERVRPFAYGRLRLWGSVGFIAAAGAASWAWRALGPGGFPLLLGAALALTAGAVLPFEPVAAAGPQVPAPRRPLSAGVWTTLAVLAANQVFHGPYYAFFSIHLVEAGYGSVAVGALWSLGVLAELAAFAGAGRLERRWGHRRLLLAALGGAGLRWAVLSLAPAPPVLVVAQLGHAASFALAHAAGIQLVQRLAPPGTARTVQAYYSGVVFGLGLVTGSVAAGPVYAALGGRGSFAAAALATAALAGAWASIAPRVRPAPVIRR